MASIHSDHTVVLLLVLLVLVECVYRNECIGAIVRIQSYRSEEPAAHGADQKAPTTPIVHVSLTNEVQSRRRST